MKILLVITALTCSIGSAIAQHYGRITFTPFAMRNQVVNFPANQGSWATFGFTAGYQGLIMPHKRFSFSYGVQYGDFYSESEYNPSKQIYNPELQSDETLLKQRDDFEMLQIPLWWRYNILKNKVKWQPFIAVSTTVDIPITSQYNYYTLENPPRVYDLNSSIGLSLDFGAGVNYYLESWCFTGQLTYSANPFPRLGLGFSIMRKF